MTDFSDDDIRACTQPDLTAAECEQIRAMARRTGLDPLAGQIHAIRRDGRLVLSTGISGLRVIAERSGEYQGQTPEAWAGSDGIWRRVWVADPNDVIAARVGVRRKGFECPLYAVAYLDEAMQRKRDGTPTRFWMVRPLSMLAKCAEAAALRKAFPLELSGVYATEELQAEPHEDVVRKTESDLRARLKAKISEYVERMGAEWCGQNVRHEGRETIEDLTQVVRELEQADSAQEAAVRNTGE